MNITQNSDTADGTIEFTKEEIKILNKKGKLTFTAEEMREFSIILMNAAFLISRKCEEIKEKKNK